MNMRPDLVTREAVDAALIAIQLCAYNPSERAKVEIALATALPMLLGHPVAWMAENGNVMSARSRSTCTRASSLKRYRIPLVRADGVATTNGDETE